MRRLSLTILLVLPSLAWPAETTLNGHTFTLPDGFEIELVAGPPLVNRPIAADFDDEGRLYVADSSGSNEKVELQLQKKPHRVVRLEDTTGTGRFDKGTVFADRLMFPAGVLWRDGSIYVAAPPSIWKLTDTHGTGTADQRVELFQGKTLTGCANDLHGPYAGPDGWIYWCKGAFARQTYDRPGRPPFVTRAAHIFRCRPDGSGVEPVMTGGMDNPVHVVFTPGGERIFTTTFLQNPGGGRRDGLIHAVYGGVYGKDHDVVHEHPWTGPDLMPVLTHLGPAAPCGLTRYESNVFGTDYQDNLFACQFNMQKVSRHIVEADGATFKTRDLDFVVSNNHDFHPTDVLEDADGSLLILDTGGWYRLCCPSSQLGKPDVLGAIYRVRRKGAPRLDDPRGRKIAWEALTADTLAKLLDDPRPVVRRRAIAVLAKRADALPAIERVLRDSAAVEARRNAVWAATRIDGAAARAAVRRVLADSDETVRQVALHSISLWRDADTLPMLVKLLDIPSAQNRRCAAEALGRIGDRRAVPALLAAVGTKTDRVLEHSLIYALIDIADRDGVRAGLKSANVRTHRAALIALDQMKADLDAPTVERDLSSPDAAMSEAAAWIVGRHPEWGDWLAGYLSRRLANLPAAEKERAVLVEQLARFAGSRAVMELLSGTLQKSDNTRDARVIALRAMALARPKTNPPSWLNDLAEVIASNDNELVSEAVRTAHALSPSKGRSGKLSVALLRIGSDDKRPDRLRLTALAALPGLTNLKPTLFSYLIGRLDREGEVAARALAADTLARAKLDAAQLIALAAVLKTTGPMEMNHLLDAYVQSTDDKVGLALLAALDQPDLHSRLRAELIRPRLTRYGSKVQQRAEKLYAALDKDLEKRRARLAELLPTLKDGDARRGQAVFHNAKLACASCHTIGYVGGKVGPDLTRVGRIRTERDLLESILFPSATFVRSYEPMIVYTKQGKTYNGVLKQDTADEVILALNATDTARIARKDIEEIRMGTVSIMPDGLDKLMTPRELADLVAFLKGCR